MSSKSLCPTFIRRLRRKDTRSKAEVIDSIRNLMGLPADIPDEEVEARVLAFQKRMHAAMLPMREATENMRRAMQAMADAMERKDAR
jgi:hypothetical protein